MNDSNNFLRTPKKKNARIGEKSTPAPCRGNVSRMGFKIRSVI